MFCLKCIDLESLVALSLCDVYHFCFSLFHSDGPGYLQRAAGRRGSVRSAVWRERPQRCRGRGSVLVSRLSFRRQHTKFKSASVLNVFECVHGCLVTVCLREMLQVQIMLFFLLIDQ